MRNWHRAWNWVVRATMVDQTACQEQDQVIVEAESPAVRPPKSVETDSQPRTQALEKHLETAKLEEHLKTAKLEEERKAAFFELVTAHGEVLVVQARRQAAVLGLGASPAGDEAINEVFIRLTQSLDSPWPRDKSFLDRFRVEVWSELRHQRTRVAKTRLRFSPIAEEDDPEEPAANPERRYESSEQLQKVVRELQGRSRTRKQRRLAHAWSLSKLGYGWMEVKKEVKWPGTSDSLRASVSRFFSQIKSRILEHKA